MKNESADRFDPGRRVGRISLDDGRRILAMVSRDDTFEAIAMLLRRSPEAIEAKAKSLGLVRKGSAWRDQRQALCAALLSKKPEKSSLRAGKPWLPEDDRQLRRSICEGRSAREIAVQAQRTTRAVRRRAELLKLSWLAPTSLKTAMTD
jgi:hypothetical protein